MMKQTSFFFFSFLAGGAGSAADVTFRAETRVVTVDVMVEDSRSRKPVDDLTRGDFRLRIDGKDRPLTYFGRNGVERRPLAMLVYLNLAPDGGLRELSRPAAIESLAAALGRLSAEDEVAVYAATDWFVGDPKEMTPLTRARQDAARGMRAAIEAALAASREERDSERAGRQPSMTMAIAKAREVAGSRPGSQVALVYISDGMNTLDTMESRNRRKLAGDLQRENISFSALDLRMMGSYAAAAAVLNPVGMAFGFSVTGSSDYLAKQTGGVVEDVAEAAGLGAALDRVFSSYVTRYSLGYQVGESEYRSGRVHRIDVRLVGDAAKGRTVISRKGFVATGLR